MTRIPRMRPAKPGMDRLAIGRSLDELGTLQIDLPCRQYRQGVGCRLAVQYPNHDIGQISTVELAIAREGGRTLRMRWERDRIADKSLTILQYDEFRTTY